MVERRRHGAGAGRTALLRGVPSYVSPLTGVVVLIVLWSVAGRAGWGDGMIVSPKDALEPIFGGRKGAYYRATKATLWASFRGLTIGGGLAFVSALIAASVPQLRRTIVRLAAIANAAPWVAVAPCLLIVLGRERGPVAVAAIAVFFFIFVATSVGLSAASPALHDVAGALGASSFRKLWSIQLPAAWPSIADGLKLATPASLAGAVFGEWYGSERGLGVQLVTAMQNANAQQLWAASLLSAACGVFAYGLLAWVRSRAVRRYGAEIAQPVPKQPDHSWLRRMSTETIAMTLMVGLLVAAWWIWIEVKNISPIVVPSPSRVLDDLVSNPGEYVSATWRTVWTAAIALAIGTAVGLLAALSAARFEFLAGMTVPLMVVLSATPLVALFPLFARMLGYNPKTIWALSAVMVFYPIFVFARSGLAAASRSQLDVVDALGGSASMRYRHVVLAAAVPHIVSGFRIAAGSAVIAAVVGESLIGTKGLGREFAYAYKLLEMGRAFGAAIVVVAVSVAVFSLVGMLERSVHAKWT
jgi:ABC-type nitrate/sulfonate/bicarbonate transport system permease component